MALQAARWQLAPPVSAQALAELGDVPPLLGQLLHNRNIVDRAQAEDFLKGRANGGDPFLLKGMDRAVDRLQRAIRQGEVVAVYGDFDTDGVTATALLVETLSALGAQVKAYIPHRVDEGYGLNLDALRRLWRGGVRVVVTVDCGVRAVSEVEQASRGLDLIITDHHSVGENLPAAVSVLNPKQKDCAYPFKDLAGVGVAYKLAQALLRESAWLGQASEVSESSLLDLVALGTVADMMPLLGENRSLVRHGLAELNRPRRPGVEALMADASLRRGQVDATAIGFRLGPRLNAAGRMDSAMLAYRLLRSRDLLETRELAGQLGLLNQQRQTLTEKTVAAAEAQILEQDPEVRLYLAASRDFQAGIVGLAASRLKEAYYRPSVVVEVGAEKSRGSCRSIPEFNITRALEKCEELLVRYGGHDAAAGFTVMNSQLDTLREQLQALAAKELDGVELRPTLEIDAELPLEEATWDTRRLLEAIEPCGMGNPAPLLLSRGVEVRGRRALGSDNKHLKLSLVDRHRKHHDAIFFRAGDLLNEIPSQVDVVYTLAVNDWNGRRQLQLQVKDLGLPAESS